MAAPYLIQHAIDNVWCSPDQDAQATFAPARVGTNSGFISFVPVNTEIVPLPYTGNTRQYWRVFVLGPLPSYFYNFPTEKNTWLSLPDVTRKRNIFFQLYSDDGLVFPNTMAMLRQIHDGTYILALRYHRSLPIDFDVSQLYVRVYSNSYFKSARWTTSAHSGLQPILVHGGVIGTDFTAGQFVASLNAIPDKGVGVTLVYRNGNLITNPNTASFQPGDVAEYVHDRSIKRVETYNIPDLEAFVSDKDSKDKYILYPQRKGDTIDYYDDVDFYITRRRNTNQQTKGILYPRREERDAVRMLTHNAYSVPIQYVSSYIGSHPFLQEGSPEPDWSGNQPAMIVLYVRHSGYYRPLIHEHHRINELYKLPLPNILEAMTGVNSLVPLWRAESLEESGYTTIMSAAYRDITQDLVADAYGYNSATKVSYPAVHVLQGSGNQRYLNRPGDFLYGAVYGYDADGYMTGVKNYPGGDMIIPANPIIDRSVEMIARQLDEVHGNTFYGEVIVQASDLIKNLGVRCYVCDYRNGVPTENWRDVTGDDDYYEISANGRTVLWKDDLLRATNEYPATRFGGKVWFERSVPFSTAFSGVVDFSVANENTWRYPTIDSGTQTLYRPDSVPFGQIEIFMGTSSTKMQTLVEGIDYYVVWPRVTIVKVPEKIPSEGLIVSVRCSGFCRSDLSHYPPREAGWVVDGLVSADGKYDVRNDRNCKVIVDGKFKRLDQVKFSEDSAQGVRQRNGAPYGIVDIIQPTEYLLNRDTEAYRDISVAVDDMVSDYLTEWDPGSEPGQPSPIDELYWLYEPLTSRIISNLLSGWLSDGRLDQPYTIDDIDEWLEPDKYLLDFSPTLRGINRVYATVTPHPYSYTVSLTLAQYRFLDRVIANYFDGNIPLAGLVTVED